MSITFPINNTSNLLDILFDFQKMTSVSLHHTASFPTISMTFISVFTLNDNWLTDKSKTDLTAVGVVCARACLTSVREWGMASIIWNFCSFLKLMKIHESSLNGITSLQELFRTKLRWFNILKFCPLKFFHSDVINIKLNLKHINNNYDLVMLLFIFVLDLHLSVFIIWVSVSHLVALWSPQSPGYSSSSLSPGCSEEAEALSQPGPSPNLPHGSSPAVHGSSFPTGSWT